MRVLLVQLPVSSLVAQEVTGNVPLAGATLAVHAQRQCGAAAECVLCPPEVQNRAGDAALVARIASFAPDAVGFTCTVWNIERTMHLMRGLSERIPRLRIWLGGPEIASDNALLSKGDAPFDCAVENEGEGAFALLCAGTAPARLNGVLLPGGIRASGGRTPPALETLDAVHDPFCLGIVAPEADGVLLAECTRGCTHRCMFCRYHHGRGGGKLLFRSYERIDELLACARGRAVAEIYLLDPSIEQRPDFDAWCSFLAAVNRDPVIPIFAELRAERIDETKARQLAAAGVRAVETGLQTVTGEALQAVGRRLDAAAFTRGVDALRAHGIRVRVDIMLGLPGDTPEGLENTLQFVQGLGLGERTQVFRTQVLPGTELRERTPALGIAYEPRPPYFVLSTPTWPADALEAAVLHAEATLGVTHTPEDRPVLPSLRRFERGVLRADFDATGLTYAVAYDLEADAGRRGAEAEDFARVATTLTAVFRAARLVEAATSIDAWIRRCTARNPFISLSVVLWMPPGQSCAPLAGLRSTLIRYRGSRYRERMTPAPWMLHPQRRLLCLFSEEELDAAGDPWRTSLAESAEIIWRRPCESEEEAVEFAAAARADPEDYLFLDIAEQAAQVDAAPFFTALAARGREPERILLPALAFHWAWVRFLETTRAAGA